MRNPQPRQRPHSEFKLDCSARRDCSAKPGIDRHGGINHCTVLVHQRIDLQANKKCDWAHSNKPGLGQYPPCPEVPIHDLACPSSESPEALLWHCYTPGSLLCKRRRCDSQLKADGGAGLCRKRKLEPVLSTIHRSKSGADRHWLS